MAHVVKALLETGRDSAEATLIRQHACATAVRLSPDATKLASDVVLKLGQGTLEPSERLRAGDFHSSVNEPDRAANEYWAVASDRTVQVAQREIACRKYLKTHSQDWNKVREILLEVTEDDSLQVSQRKSAMKALSSGRSPDPSAAARALIKQMTDPDPTMSPANRIRCAEGVFRCGIARYSAEALQHLRDVVSDPLAEPLEQQAARELINKYTNR